MKKKVIFIISIIVALYTYFELRVKLKDLKPLRDYAITLEPWGSIQNTKNMSTGSICYTPVMPPDDVLFILKRSRVSEEFKVNILLIYLKLYSYQLVNYHQSFDVRDMPFFIKRYKAKSALSRAFCEVVGKNWVEKKIGPEFLSAGSAYEYVNENPKYIEDPYILEQMKIIDSLTNQLK